MLLYVMLFKHAIVGTLLTGSKRQCLSFSNTDHRTPNTEHPSTTGSLGFGLARETEIVCGVRKADNSFETMSYTFGAKDMGWEKEVGFESLVLCLCSAAGSS